MSIECPQRYPMARGGSQHAIIDWGENTAGQETGALKDADTVQSCAVALVDSPTGSTTPTLGSVSVNVTDIYVNGRLCSTGEATSCLVTMGAAQGYGKYILRFTATTTNGEVIPRDIVIDVVAR